MSQSQSQRPSVILFDMPASYRLGDYLLGMQGLAILRKWGTDPLAVRERAQQIIAIAEAIDSEPYSGIAVVPEFNVAGGYQAWAATYDSVNNILINAEEGVVLPLLDAVPVGRALDAACGTGRYARWLEERGHEVTGIDVSEEMLSVARAKAPAASFQTGTIDSLDFPDGSFDLVVCALALTHLSDIEQAIAEFARVLAPGGRLVLSDVHPLMAALGLHAFFRSSDGKRGCIQNCYHPMSQYLSAFRAANLAIEHCVEVPWDDVSIAAQPSFPLIPDALEMALRDLPLLLIWELVGS